MGRDQVQRGQPARQGPGHRVAMAPTIRSFRFFMSAWATEQSLAFLPGPLPSFAAPAEVKAFVIYRNDES